MWCCRISCKCVCSIDVDCRIDESFLMEISTNKSKLKDWLIFPFVINLLFYVYHDFEPWAFQYIICNPSWRICQHLITYNWIKYILQEKVSTYYTNCVRLYLYIHLVFWPCCFTIFSICNKCFISKFRPVTYSLQHIINLSMFICILSCQFKSKDDFCSSESC